MSTPLVSRAAAGLKPPKATPPAISSEGQTAHYGGPSPWGSRVDRSSPERFVATADHARCASIWRAWQSFHMRPVAEGGRGWNDIAYNSGVCPHGVRYEGRGPGVRSGANGTTAGNARSTATCYIAGEGDPLTEGAQLAFGDEFVRMSPARWVHSDWKPTGCPGDPIRAWQQLGWPLPPEDDEMIDYEKIREIVQTEVTAELRKRGLVAATDDKPGGAIGELRRNMRATAEAAGVPPGNIEE